jgi:murein DD-endopeptidase MepM/ murein hydrolase activator NlpD
MGRVSVRVVLMLGMAAAAVVAVASGAPRPAPTPGASAQAWAIRIVVPNQPGGGTKAASAPPVSTAVTTQGFAYPPEGSIVAASSTNASASTAEGETASSAAVSRVDGLVIFLGEIVADSVSAGAAAEAGAKRAGGGFDGTEVVNLRVNGAPVSGDRIRLGDWGMLTVNTRGVDRGAPQGAVGYRGFVTVLDVHLTAEHGGLPAGSAIQVGYAEASAQTPPAKPEPLPKAPGDPDPSLRPAPDDKSKLLLPVIPIPSSLHPDLEAGPYFLPVYGSASYINTYGDPRPDVSYHHGADIFGEVGQPLVACADGTVFSVGWNKIGGIRLWLRDKQGNEYYYAHLSAYSTLASNGARVKAGQVIGFMGTTGDAEGGTPHLHFEIHPVSLLYLGYDGAVDPTPYLDEWRRLERLTYPLPLAWAPSVPGRSRAPQPGAYLLAASDISSADGLDPASLRRAIETTPARP